MDIKKLDKRALKFYKANKFRMAISNWGKILKYDTNSEAKRLTYYNIGLSYYKIAEYSKSLEYLNKSNSIKKTPETDWNLSLCYLQMGDWERGMSLYFNRYKTKSNTSVHFPNYPIPQFTTVDQCKDKNILVKNEQGFGDEIMFSLKIREFSKYVNRATIKVSSELIELFKHIYGDIENIEFKSFDTISYQDVINYDGFIALGDIFSDLYKIGDNLSLNLHNGSGENVGICWSSNVKSPIFENKSLNLEDIIDPQSNDWTSLQYGEFGFKPKNFLETYKKIMSLNKVITIDTSVAHLAGLIGIETVLIINKYLDWRWKYSYIDGDSVKSKLYHNVKVINIKDWNNI